MSPFRGSHVMSLDMQFYPVNHPSQSATDQQSQALKGSLPPEKQRAGFWTAALLAAALLISSACLRIATTPIRMERRERAEAAFNRLAELSPEKIAAFLDQRMTTQLTLAEEQIPRVAALNLDHARQLHRIATSNDNIRDKGRAMSKQNDAHETALKAVLTDDQFTRFLAMKEEMRDALKDMRSAK